MTEWRLVIHDGVGAAEGLAVDEALMAAHHRAGGECPPTLRLYTYASHAALVGRYQHLEAEVDLEACRRTGTGVSRRPTGGGAIVMGEGQLGVAVVTSAPAAESPRSLLERYSGGIVAGLAELGVPASFRGKNDLEVGGKKIAGLGLYVDGHGGLLFHASVLADLDVGLMLQVLTVPAAKLGDKGIAAVGERITTVTRETGRAWTGAALREAVAVGFEKALGIRLRAADLDAAEQRAAQRLSSSRYTDPGWLRQRSPHPDATGTSVCRTPAGLVRVYVSLSGATIKSALFAGDFNSLPGTLAAFETALRWKRLDLAEIEGLARRTRAGAGLGVEPGTVAGAVVDAGQRALARAGAAPVRPAGSCYFPEARGGSDQP